MAKPKDACDKLCFCRRGTGEQFFPGPCPFAQRLDPVAFNFTCNFSCGSDYAIGNQFIEIYPEGRKPASIVAVKELREGIGIEDVHHRAFRETYSSSLIKFFGLVSK